MKFKSLLLSLIFSSVIITTYAQINEEKYKQSNDMITNYQFADAASILVELINSDSDNYLYQKDLAYCYLNQRNYEKALTYYEKALELNPSCIICFSELARTWYELGDLDNAIIAIDKGIELSDTTALLYATRGLIYQALENYDNAMFDFSKAIQLDKSNPDYLITRANFYIQTNQTHFAYSDISDAIKINPKKSEYYYYRSYILHNLKLFDEALIDIQKAINLDSTVADYFNLQFSIHFSRKEYDLAEQSANKSLEILPDSYLTYINLADLYFQSNQMEKYCYANQKALNLIPKSDNYQAEAIRKTTDKYCNNQRMPYYFVRALTLYNQKDYAACIEILSDGLKIVSKSSVLENLMATSYMSIQNYDKAFEYFTKSYENKEMLKSEVVDFYSVDIKDSEIEFVSNSYIVKSDFGLAMINLINHNTEKALERLNEAEKTATPMEEFEGKESIYNVKGYAYIVDGLNDKAIEQFDLAISKNPYYQQSHLNKALLILFEASKFKSSKLEFIFSDYFNSLRIVLPKLKLKKGNDDKLNEALKICNTVIENDPRCAYAYLIKAKIAQLSGDENYKNFANKAIELGIVNTYEELNNKK